MMEFNYAGLDGQVHDARPCTVEDILCDITTEYSGVENRVAMLEKVVAQLIETSLGTEEAVAKFLNTFTYRKVVPHKER